MLVGSLAGAVVVFGLRFYVLDMCVRSFKFGCDTASLKATKLYGPDVGNSLYAFCEAYTNNIKTEFFGRRKNER